MPRPRRTPRAWNRFAHFLPYHVGNSWRGLRRAVAQRFKRADVDVLMSKDGVAVAAHWDLPLRHGFYDPLRITRKGRKVWSMSYRHLIRLRTKEKVRIQSLADMFKEAGKLGLTLELDLKKDRRFEDPAHMRRIKRDADKHGCEAVVKVLTDVPGAAKMLRAAKMAGFTTIVCPRGDKRLKRGDFWPWADYVRGPVTWVDDRYERVNFRGKMLDRWTVAALLEAERRLGYPLSLSQGSYNGGRVSASAGTHDGGGALDATTRGDYGRAVEALRRAGFAAWHRTPDQGPWPHHIHAVLIGNDQAAPSAKRQVAAYKRGRNGLANNGPDDGPRVPIKEHPYV